MKIDRLLAMTVLLLNRKRVSAKEMAQYFEVSTKTVYRDMETLNQSGIPIVNYKGIMGGFEIMESYTLNRQLLTIDDLTALVSAVKGMNSALDDRKLANLLEKVKALLGKTGSINSEVKKSAITFDFNPWGQSGSARDKINALKQASETFLCVKINYLDREGAESERIIEPVKLIMKANLWYLQAYCQASKDFRMFRVSRIQQLQLLAESFIPREAPVLERYDWNPEWFKEAQQELTLLFQPKARYRVEETFPAGWMTELADGRIQVKGSFTVDEWFYGMLLSYGEQVKVEQPDDVAEELVRRAQKIMEQYSK
ncbi:Predicted DNA-binding transcriptional regulator YafY, contains an HTH and WYL domains [Paenibacillaceae bacterium GAS479]|nr:Predicted DNA-binding transcriptional regulator YafY, contains an HTH and WYL domains [Paenibacillaceae bacterium GAS479]